MCTLEYGTFDRDSGQRAFRADHWLHKYGDPLGQEAGPVRSAMRRQFYPETDDWKEAVLFRGHQVVRAADRRHPARRSLGPGPVSGDNRPRKAVRGATDPAKSPSMRALVALLAFVAMAALNFLWWSLPNRPVEIAGWTTAPLQSVSFAPYRPGQSPLTRTFPTAEQIDDDLRPPAGQGGGRADLFDGRESRGRTAACRQVRPEGLARRLAQQQREGKSLEQINLLIDHANKYKDTIERVIVGNEVLLRKDLTANELRRYIRQVKQPRDAARDLCRCLGVLAAQPVACRRGRFHHHPHPALLGGRADRARSPRARREAQHREAHRRHLQEGPGRAFPTRRS